MNHPADYALTAPAVPGSGSDRRRGSPWVEARERFYFWISVPAFLVLFVVVVAPLAYLIATSFTPLNLTIPNTFVFRGLLNYRQAFESEAFWSSLRVQAELSLFTIVLQSILGVSFALLLNSRARGFDSLRIFYLVPMVLPPVVVAIIWRVLFTPDISPIYWLLQVVGLPHPAWLTDPVLALWAIIIADTWEWTPFVLLIVLAALQTVPEEPLEAARIDGAGNWQVIRSVILPIIRPSIVVAALLRLIESVKAFPLIFIMTNGGPGVATQPTNYYAYLQAFSYSFIGYSSAVIVVILVVTLVVSFFIARMMGSAVQSD